MREFTVYPESADTSTPEIFPLHRISKGELGRITEIRSKELTLTLLKMGIVEGDQVQITDIAPFGDPIAFRVNGTKISLRKKDASNIWVSKM